MINIFFGVPLCLTNSETSLNLFSEIVYSVWTGCVDLTFSKYSDSFFPETIGTNFDISSARLNINEIYYLTLRVRATIW